MIFGKRWIEFFEGESGRLSMTRLLCFLSFFPATYVTIESAGTSDASDVLMIYLGAFVLGYVGGKGADAVLGAAQAKASAAPAPINIPDASKVDVNTSGGPVTVSPTPAE